MYGTRVGKLNAAAAHSRPFIRSSSNFRDRKRAVPRPNTVKFPFRLRINDELAYKVTVVSPPPPPPGNLKRRRAVLPQSPAVARRIYARLMTKGLLSAVRRSGEARGVRSGFVLVYRIYYDNFPLIASHEPAPTCEEEDEDDTADDTNLNYMSALSYV